MKIVIDLQSLQTGSNKRGIGRYTKSFVTALIKNHYYTDTEYILLFNRADASDESGDFIQFLKNEGLTFQVTFFPVPDQINYFAPLNRTFMKGVERLREVFIAALNPDILLITSLFEFDAVTSINPKSERAYLTSVILYDLIPLEGPESYLKNPDVSAFYYEKIAMLKKAEIFLCTSNYTLRQATKMLGITPEACINISGASDLAENYQNENLKKGDLLIDIPKDFILYVGGFDRRKNVEKLVKALIDQPSDIRENFSLLLVGSISDLSKAELNKIISNNHTRPISVNFLGYVEDSFLIELYRKCTVFVFPSSREGFGLPPIEAMSFGAPVITSNRTSLPEIVSNGLALFDPDDASEFRDKLTLSLADEDFREKLIEHSRESAKTFSWRQSSKVGFEFIKRIFLGNSSTLDFGERNRSKLLLELGLYCKRDLELMKMAKLFSMAVGEINRLYNSKVIPKIPRELSTINSFSDTVPNYEPLNTPYVFSSMLCREQHFHLPLYTYWCNQLREAPRFHRKQWEFIYICQVLFERGYIRNGLTAIGFGVGKEPLASYFAKQGLNVMATDLDFDKAKDLGWVQKDQHCDELLSLNEFNICPEDIFLKNTKFKSINMNNIPTDIGKYDICWSSCAFEHLGSIRKGMDFVINSCRLLKPGGIAVHTTEFNISSNNDTLDNNKTLVIFRKKDIEQLADELRNKGFFVEGIDFTAGGDELERYIDLPPYIDEPHLRLELAGKYVSTSLGIIIRTQEKHA